MLVRVALDSRIDGIDVPEESLVAFPQGILGFEQHTQYVLFQLDEPLFLLQSVDDPHLGFVLVDPLLVEPDYRPLLPEAGRALLEADDQEPPTVLSIVGVSPQGTPRTVNLRAPLVFNAKKRLGAQVILQDSQYLVRHPYSLSAQEVEAGSSEPSLEADGASRCSGKESRQC